MNKQAFSLQMFKNHLKLFRGVCVCVCEREKQTDRQTQMVNRVIEFGLIVAGVSGAHTCCGERWLKMHS